MRPTSTTDLKTNIWKYFKYVFDTDSFSARESRGQISEHALITAKHIRGINREPAIIIHGIMKRSGTVYTGELLGLHPHLHKHPNKIWEVPFLSLTKSIRGLQREFFVAYSKNKSKIGENDFLPLFGGALIAYLYGLVPEEKRMLLKVPGVEYLDYFYDVFPYENMLVLVRDGRDVVASTIKTWTQLRFSDVCRRWDHSAKMIMRLNEQYSEREGFWLAKFEYAVKEPEIFVREACSRFNLDVDKFPFEKINAIPLIGSSTTRKQGLTWLNQKPKEFNPIGRWQQWSAWRKNTFKRLAGESLIQLGYCDNLDW